MPVGPLRLKNPVLTASGTFGFGREFAPYVDLAGLGGVVTKTLYLRRRRGNPPPRLVEVASGMLNSIGLENPGCDPFEEEILPWLRDRGVLVIASFAGENPEDFPRTAARLDGMPGLAGLEVNLSCPNVRKGGLDLGTDPSSVNRIVHEVRRETRLPLFAKLTPNVTDIQELARAAEAGGADGLSVINTIAAMAVDWRRRRSRLGTMSGGLSGPAIKPVALRMVWQASRAVRIPVIGIGGIRSAEDVLEFLVAGASAVQVGTSNFLDPTVTTKIVTDLERILAAEGIREARTVVGTLEETPRATAPASGADPGAARGWTKP